MSSTEVFDWLLKGGLVLVGSGLGWAILQIRAMRKDAAAAEEAVMESVWKRAKETMADDRTRIDDQDEEIHKLKEELRAAREDTRKEREECNRKIDAARQESADGYMEMSRKYREVLRICADQEEEIQHSRIVIAKINQRRSDPVPPPAPAPLIGGQRRYDPQPSAATVTVTVPAQGQQSELSVVRDPPKP